MKKLFPAAAGLATAWGLAVLLLPGSGRAQNPETISVPITQPGGVPAFLKQDNPPAAPNYPSSLPTTPGYQNLPSQQTGDNVYVGSSTKSQSLRQYVSQSMENVSLNNDVAPCKECGPWMICVMWYSGPEAPQLARDICLELRNNPDYKLPAYVFTKGLEERKQELERIAAYVQRQRDNLAKANLSLDTPIRVPLTRYEIQCAVLVGGFQDMDTAHRFQEQMKKLKALDSSRFKLHTQYIAKFDEHNGAAAGQYATLNPLAHAMVVRNPACPTEHIAGQTPEDMRLLRLLNEDEPYSLLKCAKPYTLVIKEFPLPVVIQPKGTTGNLFDKMALGGNSGSKEDQAAYIAHQLAELLRKANVEAYVLHMQHCSFVCAGSFSSKEDPAVRIAQERLPRLNAQLCKEIQLTPHPVLMAVPRCKE